MWAYVFIRSREGGLYIGLGESLSCPFFIFKHPIFLSTLRAQFQPLNKRRKVLRCVGCEIPCLKKKHKNERYSFHGNIHTWEKKSLTLSSLFGIFSLSLGYRLKIPNPNYQTEEGLQKSVQSRAKSQWQEDFKIKIAKEFIKVSCGVTGISLYIYISSNYRTVIVFLSSAELLLFH